MKRINRARVAAVRMCYCDIKEDKQALYVYGRLEARALLGKLSPRVDDLTVRDAFEHMDAGKVREAIDDLTVDILRLFPKKKKRAVVTKISEVMVEAISPEDQCKAEAKLPVLQLMNLYGGPLGSHPIYTVDRWKEGVRAYAVRRSYWGWVSRKLKGED